MRATKQGIEIAFEEGRVTIDESLVRDKFAEVRAEFPFDECALVFERMAWKWGGYGTPERSPGADELRAKVDSLFESALEFAVKANDARVSTSGRLRVGVGPTEVWIAFEPLAASRAKYECGEWS